MVAKTAAQRVAAQRKRRKRKGLKRREFYLTDDEFHLVTVYLTELRAEQRAFNQNGSTRT